MSGLSCIYTKAVSMYWAISILHMLAQSITSYVWLDDTPGLNKRTNGSVAQTELIFNI